MKTDLFKYKAEGGPYNGHTLLLSTDGKSAWFRCGEHRGRYVCAGYAKECARVLWEPYRSVLASSSADLYTWRME